MKNFIVTFSPVALDDVEETKAYYEKIQTGLGKRFSTQLQATLNTIRQNPFFASIRYDDIRCARVKKFPYLVHYCVVEKEMLVIIIAVYSTYREPFG